MNDPQGICLTPGAKWRTEIHWNEVSVKVGWRNEALISGLTDLHAREFENDLHDAIELVIAQHRDQADSSIELVIARASASLERDRLTKKRKK